MKKLWLYLFILTIIQLTSVQTTIFSKNKEIKDHEEKDQQEIQQQSEQDEFEQQQQKEEQHVKVNNQPIIGVLSQPSSWPKIYNESEYSYIASSYVKYLEAAGAQILPIKYDLDQEQLRKIFQNINGLFFPGGGADLLKSQIQLKQQQKKIREQQQKEKEIIKKQKVVSSQGESSKQNETFSFKELFLIPSSIKMQQDEDEEQSTEMKSNEENGGQNEELYRIDEIGRVFIGQQQTEKVEDDELTYFAKQGEFLLRLAIEANDKGEYFPVWGTCLGFEQIILFIANTTTSISQFNSTNHSLRMKLNHNLTSSRIMSQMTERMKSYLQYEKAMYFNHRYGYSTEAFIKYSNLKNFWEQLSYNHDKNGKTFVSMIEAKHYPFFGVQFHPEKNSLEWKDHLEINREMGTVQISHFFGNFFVNEVRKNQNVINYEEIKKELIYNYYPILVSESFMGVYMFNKANNLDSYMANPINPNQIVEQNKQDNPLQEKIKTTRFLQDNINNNINNNVNQQSNNKGDDKNDNKNNKNNNYNNNNKSDNHNNNINNEVINTLDSSNQINNDKDNEPKLEIKNLFDQIQIRLQDALGISKNLDKLFKKNTKEDK